MHTDPGFQRRDRNPVQRQLNSPNNTSAPTHFTRAHTHLMRQRIRIIQLLCSPSSAWEASATPPSPSYASLQGGSVVRQPGRRDYVNITHLSHNECLIIPCVQENILIVRDQDREKERMI